MLLQEVTVQALCRTFERVCKPWLPLFTTSPGRDHHLCWTDKEKEATKRVCRIWREVRGCSPISAPIFHRALSTAPSTWTAPEVEPKRWCQSIHGSEINLNASPNRLENLKLLQLFTADSPSESLCPKYSS